MKEQTNFLRKFGISAGSIGDAKALDLKIEKGACSVVFSSRDSVAWNWSVAKVSWKKNWTLVWKVFVEIFCVNSFVFHKFIMYSKPNESLNTVYYNGTPLKQEHSYLLMSNKIYPFLCSFLSKTMTGRKKNVHWKYLPLCHTKLRLCMGRRKALAVHDFSVLSWAMIEYSGNCET